MREYHRAAVPSTEEMMMIQIRAFISPEGLPINIIPPKTKQAINPNQSLENTTLEIVAKRDIKLKEAEENLSKAVDKSIISFWFSEIPLPKYTELVLQSAKRL